mmetsp:Transcript_42205/g.91979  ORF Transcript_42205/g.91979 Transcript_42205/m.91979 type:complete len:258 (-) Transcript_42205:1597-2370(-)
MWQLSFAALTQLRPLGPGERSVWVLIHLLLGLILLALPLLCIRLSSSSSAILGLCFLLLLGFVGHELVGLGLEFILILLLLLLFFLLVRLRGCWRCCHLWNLHHLRLLNGCDLVDNLLSHAAHHSKDVILILHRCLCWLFHLLLFLLLLLLGHHCRGCGCYYCPAGWSYLVGISLVLLAFVGSLPPVANGHFFRTRDVASKGREVVCRAGEGRSLLSRSCRDLRFRLRHRRPLSCRAQDFRDHLLSFGHILLATLYL